MMLIERVGQSSDARASNPGQRELRTASGACAKWPALLCKEARHVWREAGELVAIELDSEPGPVRNRQIARRVEREGLRENTVYIGAAADEFDEVGIGKGGGELQIGCDAERRVP